MSFWDVWGPMGALYIFGLLFFPRITLLFVTATPFGPLAWLGWVISPSLLIAILATSTYWHTNPILCVLAWLWFASKYTGVSSATAAQYRRADQ